MNPRFLAHDISLAQEAIELFMDPVRRLSTTPDMGKVVAVFVGAWQLLFYDLQVVAGVFMLFCAGCDFWGGTRVARLDGLYSPIAAHRGMATKVMSLLLVLLTRLAEHALYVAGLGDTGGMLAVIAAISFGIADMRSLMYHREALGAAPIPIIGSILEKISGLLNSKAEQPITPRRRRSDAPKTDAVDQGEGWEG